jgi:hypothetical protein
MGSKLRFALDSFTLAGVLVTFASQVAPIVFPDVSRGTANAITLVGAPITLLVGSLNFVVSREADRDGAPVAVAPTPGTPGTPPAPPERRAESVSLVWAGATLALVLLAMVTPASLLLAVPTGLMAFRKRKVAAGFGMVLGAIGTVVVLLLVLVPESSQSNDSQTATLCVTPFGTCPLPPGPRGVACYCGFYNGTSQ